MEESGVDCGLRAGKRDWKTDVVRDSRCFGTDGDAEVLLLSQLVVVVKLFMTRRGAFV